MNLKDFLASREKPPELYWSLVLEAGWVQAGVWYIGTEAAEVVAVSPPTAWEVEDELVGAADAALSSAIQKLPEEYQEPSKTVFGVPASWVKGGEISEANLAKIKKLCSDLSLNPVGFVVLSEAIAHLYKSEEGAPINAIIIGLGSESLEVSVFKLGNLVGTTSVSRSVSLIEDVTEGLSRFEGAVPLPSRFIVYDGKGGELEEAKELLMQSSWEETPKIKFLHTPKVETLTSDRKVLATSLAGANEIGNVSQINSKEEKEETDLTAANTNIEEVENVVPVPDTMSAEELGFSVGEDVSTKSQSPVVADIASKVNMNDSVVKKPNIPQKNIPSSSPKIGNYLDKTKKLFRGFSGKLFQKNTVVNKPRLGRRPLIVLGTFLILAILGGGVYWWFYPKADVVIYVTPKNFQESLNITFNTAGQFDGSGGIIPAQTLSTQVSGNKTKSATGSKLVGDKAKGTVQIANSNASDIDLSAGTLLVSTDNLKFVTDSDASVSAQTLPGFPGTATVNVTAGDIGAQYNLAKGEVFRVGNYSKSLVAATSQGDFTGGSSQQISAISKDDQTSLETQLKAELVSNAQDQLSSQVTPSQVFVTDFPEVNTTTENFDHKIGDAADSLQLNLGLNITAIAADKEKLYEYARGVLKDKIPSGFVLRDSQISFKFAFVSKNGNNYSYQLVIGANFLPEVDTNAIIQKIAGKTLDVTQSYLNSIPGFTRADVTLKPKLPGPLGVIPRVSKNITVEVVAEK